MDNLKRMFIWPGTKEKGIMIMVTKMIMSRITMMNTKTMAMKNMRVDNLDHKGSRI